MFHRLRLFAGSTPAHTLLVARAAPRWQAVCRTDPSRLLLCGDRWLMCARLARTALGLSAPSMLLTRPRSLPRVCSAAASPPTGFLGRSLSTMAAEHTLGGRTRRLLRRRMASRSDAAGVAKRQVRRCVLVRSGSRERDRRGPTRCGEGAALGGDKRCACAVAAGLA